jgi:hypothetical protein
MKNASVRHPLSMEPLSSPFVIPSEAEGSAVRHSGAPNFSVYNHLPLSSLSGAEGSALFINSATSATERDMIAKKIPENYEDDGTLNLLVTSKI